jgi:hypothetical protein
VTERAFRIHIVDSEGYQELVSKFGDGNMLIGIVSLPYDEAQDSLRRMRDKGHDDCGSCYDFSGGMAWGAEFGANRSKVAYAYMVDRETGTGAMYRYVGGDFDKCWCETI